MQSDGSDLARSSQQVAIDEMVRPFGLHNLSSYQLRAFKFKFKYTDGFGVPPKPRNVHGQQEAIILRALTPSLAVLTPSKNETINRSKMNL